MALTVRYPACLRYGAPAHWLSDQGGASLSHDVAAGGPRLGIAHRPRPQGASSTHLLETQGTIPRRL